MIVNTQKSKDFKVKTVCIVKFDNPRLDANGSVPGRFYQVTIDPSKMSPDGEFIRFGSNPGDEIVGWQPIDWLVISSILGEWTNENTLPLLEYAPNIGISMLVDSADSSSS